MTIKAGDSVLTFDCGTVSLGGSSNAVPDVRAKSLSDKVKHETILLKRETTSAPIVQVPPKEEKQSGNSVDETANRRASVSGGTVEPRKLRDRKNNRHTIANLEVSNTNSVRDESKAIAKNAVTAQNQETKQSTAPKSQQPQYPMYPPPHFPAYMGFNAPYGHPMYPQFQYPIHPGMQNLGASFGGYPQQPGLNPPFSQGYPPYAQNYGMNGVGPCPNPFMAGYYGFGPEQFRYPMPIQMPSMNPHPPVGLPQGTLMKPPNTTNSQQAKPVNKSVKKLQESAKQSVIKPKRKFGASQTSSNVKRLKEESEVTTKDSKTKAKSRIVQLYSDKTEVKEKSSVVGVLSSGISDLSEVSDADGDKNDENLPANIQTRENIVAEKPVAKNVIYGQEVKLMTNIYDAVKDWSRDEQQECRKLFEVEVIRTPERNQLYLKHLNRENFNPALHDKVISCLYWPAKAQFYLSRLDFNLTVKWVYGEHPVVQSVIDAELNAQDHDLTLAGDGFFDDLIVLTSPLPFERTKLTEKKELSLLRWYRLEDSLKQGRKIIIQNIGKKKRQEEPNFELKKVPSFQNDSETPFRKENTQPTSVLSSVSHNNVPSSFSYTTQTSYIPNRAPLYHQFTAPVQHSQSALPPSESSTIIPVSASGFNFETKQRVDDNISTVSSNTRKTKTITKHMGTSSSDDEVLPVSTKRNINQDKPLHKYQLRIGSDISVLISGW